MIVLLGRTQLEVTVKVFESIAFLFGPASTILPVKMLSKLTRPSALMTRLYLRRALSSSAEHSAHQPNPEFWKKVFLYVSVPAIILSAVNTYFLELEHYNHYHRPEFVPYEHLRIRHRRFPWGDGNHSLFHNPKTNPLPEGWEEV